MMKVDYLIIGAGFTGATLAERLASAGKRVLMKATNPSGKRF
jgi:UDP-galactopyranose mutase